MEFHEKLQELRKQKGLTQEELAQGLFVSRTAISKWESGRGYPSIDSLKAIAKFFSVSIDALISGQEALTVAQEDHKKKYERFRRLVFALLDVCVGMFLFLPFFGQKVGDQVFAVSLPALTEIGLYLKIAYFAAVMAIIAWGILTLALQDRGIVREKIISLALNALGVLLFIVSSQVYAAAFLFVLLTVKVLMLVKMG